jgi:ABC-type polysaccharide/polyol phosphate export permease
MVYYRIPIGPALVCLPLIVGAQVLFTIALGLLLAMWNLFYRDVKYLFEVIISVAMFATPVVYPTELLGGKLGALVRLNPMTPVIEAYRSVLLHAEWPNPWPLLVMTGFSVVLLACTWVIFHRAEFEFAENL